MVEEAVLPYLGREVVEGGGAVETQVLEHVTTLIKVNHSKEHLARVELRIPVQPIVNCQEVVRLFMRKKTKTEGHKKMKYELYCTYSCWPPM